MTLLLNNVISLYFKISSILKSITPDYSDKNSMYIQMKNKHVETTRHQQCTDTGI